MRRFSPKETSQRRNWRKSSRVNSLLYMFRRSSHYLNLCLHLSGMPATRFSSIVDGENRSTA